MKKMGLFLFLNLFLLINGEEIKLNEVKTEVIEKSNLTQINNKAVSENSGENKKETPLVVEESKEEKEKRLLIELLQKKNYLKKYLDNTFEVQAFYDNNKEISKLLFKRNKDRVEIEFFSFKDDKIFKSYENSNNSEFNTEFFSNGKLKSKEIISNGEKDSESYYENGKLKEKGTYIYSNSSWKKSGIWNEYYESSNLKNVLTYTNKGYYQTNFEDSKKKYKNFEGNNIYSDNVAYRDGEWIYYQNNEINYTANFFKNNGKIFKFYDKENKIISSITNIVFNKENWDWEGEKIYFSLDGKYLEKQIKNENVLSITGYFSNEENSIRYQGNRELINEDSEKIGLWTYFNEDGSIAETGNYSHEGAEIKEYYDYANNKLKYVGNLVNKNGEYSFMGKQDYYNEAGYKETSIDFDENGKGFIKHFYDNGSIFQEGEIYSDYMKNSSYYIGKLTEYDKNGKLKAIYNYENGNLEGDTLYYDNKEELAVKKVYEKGELIRIENLK